MRKEALILYTIAMLTIGCGNPPNPPPMEPATLSPSELAFLNKLEAIPNAQRNAYVSKHFKEMLRLTPMSKPFKDRFQADTTLAGGAKS